MHSIRLTSAAGVAVLALGLATLPASATSQDQARPATEAVDQQSASPKARIPWAKNVPKCARHGKLNTSGWTDKLTLRNKCPYKFTYHLDISKATDKCITVKKNQAKHAQWGYPSKLRKVSKGGGRC